MRITNRLFASATQVECGQCLCLRCENLYPFRFKQPMTLVGCWNVQIPNWRIEPVALITCVEQLTALLYMKILQHSPHDHNHCSCFCLKGGKPFPQVFPHQLSHRRLSYLSHACFASGYVVDLVINQLVTVGYFRMVPGFLNNKSLIAHWWFCCF